MMRLDIHRYLLLGLWWRQYELLLLLLKLLFIYFALRWILDNKFRDSDSGCRIYFFLIRNYLIPERYFFQCDNNLRRSFFLIHQYNFNNNIWTQSHLKFWFTHNMHFIDADQRCINMRIADKQVSQHHKIQDYVEILPENWLAAIRKRNFN